MGPNQLVILMLPLSHICLGEGEPHQASPGNRQIARKDRTPVNRKCGSGDLGDERLLPDILVADVNR